MDKLSIAKLLRDIIGRDLDRNRKLGLYQDQIDDLWECVDFLEADQKESSVVKTVDKYVSRLNFSERLDLGRQLDKWVEENNVHKGGLGYISALQSLGFQINADTSQEFKHRDKPTWKCSTCYDTGKLMGTPYDKPEECHCVKSRPQKP